MKNIVLKFIGTGINNTMQASIEIYDRFNNLLCIKKTYNGEIVVSLKEKEVYRLVGTLCNNKLNASFYVNERNKYVFIFNNCIYNMRTITLKDANYNDLPIGKGMIVLWQKQ